LTASSTTEWAGSMVQVETGAAVEEDMGSSFGRKQRNRSGVNSCVSGYRSGMNCWARLPCLVDVR
jgi:hypothetical protein